MDNSLSKTMIAVNGRPLFPGTWLNDIQSIRTLYEDALAMEPDELEYFESPRNAVDASNRLVRVMTLVKQDGRMNQRQAAIVLALVGYIKGDTNKDGFSRQDQMTICGIALDLRDVKSLRFADPVANIRWLWADAVSITKNTPSDMVWKGDTSDICLTLMETADQYVKDGMLDYDFADILALIRELFERFGLYG